MRKFCAKTALARVVYEATGAYHSGLERALGAHLPLVKVNPLQARRFAQAQGVRAKTDDISAIKELIEVKKAEKKAREPKKQDGRSTRTLLYWNPDNHKQSWSGKGKKPDWIKVDLSEIENHPRYIHKRHPLHDDLVPDRKHHELVPK